MSSADLSAARAQFEAEGYCVLRGVISPSECDAIEAMYDQLTHPTAELKAAMGRDFGDQSQGFGVVSH